MSIEKTLETLTNAWNSQDIDTIVGLFCSDGSYHEPSGPENLGRTHHGAEEIRAAISAGFAMFPDGKIVPTAPVVVTGNHAHSEWDFEFSDKSGATVRVHGVDVFTFEGDLIKHKNAFLKQYIAAA